MLDRDTPMWRCDLGSDDSPGPRAFVPSRFSLCDGDMAPIRRAAQINGSLIQDQSPVVEYHEDGTGGNWS